jgi:HEAT repeat protein
MIRKDITKMTLAAGVAAVVTDKGLAETNSAAVNKAIESLKTYDWGVDRKTLDPIDRAINASKGDADARKALEKSLVDVLTKGISRSAQDYVCRRLRVIGTGQSVKALAALLTDEETSHIARFALEGMPNRKAGSALRNALPKVSSTLKPGIIGSLGVRRDKKSAEAIAKLLSDSDVNVARAAAHALGLIGTSAAAKQLSSFAKNAPAGVQISVSDACLLCAEQLLADGEKAEATALYKALRGEGQPKQVKMAAMKGMLTAASKK